MNIRYRISMPGALCAIIFVALVGACMPASAQSAREIRVAVARKLDARLKSKLDALLAPAAAGWGAESFVAVFVRGDVPRAAAAIERAGGRVGCRLNRILTARIPQSRIAEVALDPSVEWIEQSASMAPLDDSLHAAIGADMVHAARAPLALPYTGKGVIVGIIDVGFDIDHMEFRDRHDTTRSRILSIWSQVAEIGRSPQSFTFGTEWTGDVIQGEIDGTTSGIIPRQELSEGTHGTHVAGIAAGLHGVAPDAGLILVQVPDLPWNPDLDVEVLEGAEYIFQKADELGRPCVINISLGDDRHYRDGADLMSQGLDELVAAHGGRVICAAAGNNAINPHHWGGFPAERDSIWTYVYGNSWHLRIPDSALSTLEFSVSVDSGYQETTTFLKRLPWRTVKEIRDVPGTIFDTVRDARGDVYAIVEMTAAAPPAGNTGVLIEVDAKEFNLCRIAVRGRGYFHMWTNDLVQPFVVQSSHWPINPRYRLPNSQFDISRPGVARNVITVGSSVNRVSYNDIDGNQRDIWPQSGAGDLSDFSGIGPTADGRVKPDITAPGDNVVSARSNHATADRPEIWGPDTTMMVMSGTSMASPAAAGAVALYLEKNPRATFGQVRDAIIATARRDAATASHGPLPNEYWGNGKLDIFAALTGLRSGVAVGAPALLPFMLR